MNTKTLRLPILAALLAAVTMLPPARALTPEEAELSNLLTGLDSRAPGMSGNRDLEKFLARQFRKSGFVNGQVSFRAPVFEPGVVTLTPVYTPGPGAPVPAGGKPVRLEPMHPTLMRPGNFEVQPKFETRLVYLGQGRDSDLAAVKGVDLNGSVALMDFQCQDRWERLLRFGIKGFVFIGRSDGEYEYTDSSGKVYNSEVNVPRFFVGAAEGRTLRESCRARGQFPVVITTHRPSAWKIETLHNPWVLIPGGDKELAKEVVLFTVPLDANSIVPGRAAGGQAAGNLQLAIQLLEDFKTKKPERTVMLAGVNAHTQYFLGERMLAWHLMGSLSDVEDVRYSLAKDMRVMGLYLRKYGMLQLTAPEGLTASEVQIWTEVLAQLDGQKGARSKAVVKAPAAPATAPAGATTAPASGPASQPASRPSTASAPASGPAAEPPARDFWAGEEGDKDWFGRQDSEADTELEIDSFTHEQYLKAIEAAAEKFRDEGRGFWARLTTDVETAKARKDDIEQAEGMKKLTWEEMKAKARRCAGVYHDEKLFESWRTDLDGSTGVRLPIKAELQNEAKRALNRIKSDMMGLAKNAQLTPAQRDERMAKMKVEKEDMTKVLVLFNKIDVGMGRSRVRYRHIAPFPGRLAVLRGYRDRVMTRLTGQEAATRQALQMDSQNAAARAALGGRKVVLTFCLDVNYTADRVGPCGFNTDGDNQWQLKLGKRLSEIASRTPRVQGKSPFENTMSRAGGREETYFFHSVASGVSAFQAAGKTPAVSLRSAYTGFGRAFSPADTFDRVDPKGAAYLQTWLRQYLREVIADKDVTTTEVLGAGPGPKTQLWSSIIRTFTLDQFSDKIVPDQPIPGCLIALYAADSQGATVPTLADGDVMNVYGALADDSGTAVLYGLWEDKPLASIAYQLDGAGAVSLYDVDKGRVQESQQLNSNVVRLPAMRTLPMFPCTEFPIYDRIDPTGIGTDPITVKKVWVMSAANRAAPQKYGTHGVTCLSTAVSHVSSGPISVTIWRKDAQLPPERVMVITDTKRCLLGATPADPEGAGFLTPMEMGQDFYSQVARDMDLMNRKRLAEMAGVANDLVEMFLARARESLQEMVKHKAAHDATAFRLASDNTLGSEVKAYEQIWKMNRDMLKAVVLYMALMVPFCFFLQKLLFHFTRLEHEVLAFILMFTGTYAVFRLIHPAFRVASQPEAIFIAFVLGAIGCFVTWILNKRFQAEMQILFRSSSGMGASVAYSTVGQMAMMIGVNNMKRRRIRTTLTTGTIILVVFTMLAFSSVSQRISPTLLRSSDESPYSGFFYHWPTGKAMDEATATVLQELYGDRAYVHVRRFLAPPEPIRMQPEGPEGKGIDIQAIVGLPVEEQTFLGRLAMVYGQFFSSSDADEVVLTTRAFEALKLPSDRIEKGQIHLSIRGHRVRLVGVIDDDRYRFLRDLDPEQPLLPRRPPPKGQQQQATADAGEQLVDVEAVAFLPARTAGRLGAAPFTVSIRFADRQARETPVNLWKEMMILLDVTNARFHVGAKQAFRPEEKNARPVREGVYFVSGGYSSSIGGIDRLFIPLLIAGSIILNTMLGTVYERKYEIAIYNAIGLNPTHIFLFFLAEAFVYGVIGSVAGYLVGQLLAMALKATGLVAGVNINFSSLIVAYAILFTIALVLLSTVYPALVATRTAVPSGKRTWSLPEHDGRQMLMPFPFIYQPNLVAGVMFYLYEYFQTYTEQSIGDLIARLDSLCADADPKGRLTFHLEYTIALAPYDLGVTQRTSIAAYFDEKVDSYRVHMDVRRTSGQDTNWVTTNRPFLEKLRKLLIRWRSLDPTQHAWYVEQGSRLFGVVPQDKEPAKAD